MNNEIGNSGCIVCDEISMFNKCKCGGSAYIYNSGYATLVTCDACGDTFTCSARSDEDAVCILMYVWNERNCE